MKRRRAEGLPHSIQARLKAKAEAEGRPFAELLDLYGLERFIHRLATSRHADHFVLKGALLIRHWLGTDTRPTRDIDLMGPAELGPEVVRQVLADVLERQAADDGLEFELSPLCRPRARTTASRRNGPQAGRGRTPTPAPGEIDSHEARHAAAIPRPGGRSTKNLTSPHRGLTSA